jgi:hypothetical protein
LALYALNEPPKPWRTIPEFPDAFLSLILKIFSVIFAIAKKKSAKMQPKSARYWRISYFFCCRSVEEMLLYFFVCNTQLPTGRVG